MMHRIVIYVFLLEPLLALAAAPEEGVSPRPNAQALKPHYEAFVASLNHRQMANDYPGAVRNLDSADPKRQIVGIKTLASTDDIRAIPWIVPLFDSEDRHIRIYAGQALNALVASHELKRRDKNRPDRVVILPPGPGDTDISPMAWVILNMLRCPDDGNTHAFAANMIGYLRLDQFEGDLRQLLKSRHPAVTRAARNALKMLGADQPDAVSEVELEAARASIDVTRQADSNRFTKAYALIQQGEYEEALHLLNQNIAETPNAGNIDYSYAWGCVCAAHLGRLDKTLEYYRVMRTRFYGWLRLGANGANRKWDSQLEMVRRAVASSKHPEKEVVLKKMAAMDERARRLMLADLEQLARRAAGGDQVAILQLRQCPYGLVDLIVEGRLVPADSSGKARVDNNSEIHTLEGTAIEKPWTKSRESWNAGGSEYYVLDVGQGKLPQGSRSAPLPKNPQSDTGSAVKEPDQATMRAIKTLLPVCWSVRCDGASLMIARDEPVEFYNTINLLLTEFYTYNARDRGAVPGKSVPSSVENNRGS